MSMELYEEPWEWYVRDMIRYNKNTDTFTCVHRDFEDHCSECQVILFHIEASIIDCKIGRDNDSQKR